MLWKNIKFQVTGKWKHFRHRLAVATDDDRLAIDALTV